MVRGVNRLIVVCCLLIVACCELMERSKIIHHPHGTAMGAGNEIVLFNQQIIDGGHRKVRLPTLPVGAIIQRKINARFPWPA